MGKQNLILWIEDEKDIVDVAGEILREEGYEVDVAYDGVEGLEKIRELHPELVILDMNMPRMSGMEVYQKIYNPEKKRPICPVLAVTARADLKELFLELNVQGFVTKPFVFEELLEDVHLIFEKLYGARPEKVQTEELAPTPVRETVRVKAVRKTNRIVLVDESDQLQAQVMTYFSNYGYDVIYRTSAVDAMESLLKWSADAILINIKLSDMSGEELIHKLKQMPRTMDIPIVLYSQNPLDEDVAFRIGQETGYEIPYIEQNSGKLFDECQRLIKEFRASQ